MLDEQIHRKVLDTPKNVLLAGRITGIMLQMDNSELLAALDDDTLIIYVVGDSEMRDLAPESRGVRRDAGAVVSPPSGGDQRRQRTTDQAKAKARAVVLDRSPIVDQQVQVAAEVSTVEQYSIGDDEEPVQGAKVEARKAAKAPKEEAQ